MAEEIVRYDYIRLEPAKNGFTLSYECVKKNPMKPEGTFDHCHMGRHEEEVFQVTDSVSYDQALDEAAERLKELHRFNRDKTKNPEY